MESAIWLGHQRSLSVSKFAKSPIGDFEPQMLAVGLSMDDAEEAIKGLNLDETTHGRVCIAAVNSPLSVTLSGDNKALDAVKEWCEGKNLFAR